MRYRPTSSGGSGALPAGWALDEGVGALFEGGEVVEVVSERAEGRAWRVALEGEEVRERALDPRLLPQAFEEGAGLRATT